MGLIYAKVRLALFSRWRRENCTVTAVGGVGDVLTHWTGLLSTVVAVDMLDCSGGLCGAVTECRSLETVASYWLHTTSRSSQVNAERKLLYRAVMWFQLVIMSVDCLLFLWNGWWHCSLCGDERMLCAAAGCWEEKEVPSSAAETVWRWYDKVSEVFHEGCCHYK